MFILQVNSVQCVDFGVARWYITTPNTMKKNPLWGNFVLFFFGFLFVKTKLNVLYMLAFDRA